MELEDCKELVDTGKSRRTWSVPTVSLRLPILNVFHGLFGPKMAVFGPKLQFLKLRSATCESRSRPPPSSFLLKLCVIVLNTHRYHPPKFQPNPKHQDGGLIFSHFARAAACLLAACLLAAKPGRSTVDPKKGYKTKTGSTSSVTLTLTLPPPPPSPLAGRPPDPRPDPPPRPPAGTPRMGFRQIFGGSTPPKYFTDGVPSNIWGLYTPKIFDGWGSVKYLGRLQPPNISRMGFRQIFWGSTAPKYLTEPHP